MNETAMLIVAVVMALGLIMAALELLPGLYRTLVVALLSIVAIAHSQAALLVLRSIF